ncbi:MAG: hypothetical protein DDT32_01226 [Syntrophomonadaceae bacterium]|nr:hypothetical protein [Bacillota bacterium]MBT9147469.1 hypothetical protein [Bacillota bacterium]
MQDKIVPERQGSLLVSAEAMKATDTTVEQLQTQLDELVLVLGPRYELIVPPKINDAMTLWRLIRLSQSFQKLKVCEGFDAHIETYTKRQLSSSYFVTVLATYLCDKVNSIVFEPRVTGRIKKPDLLVSLWEEKVYLECKQIHTTKFDYYREHKHVLSILRGYMDVPHQVDIQYKRTPSDIDLHQLGKVLQQRLHQVKGDGRIISNANFDVHVQRREHYLAKEVSVTMGVISQDLHDNCSYPSHLYGINGHSVSISGPKVDYSEVLKNKIRKSRRQSPDDQPYILMIDGNSMLGGVADNIKTLSSVFQPQMNTRFSAVAIVTYHSHFNSPDLDVKFYLISNPFAKLSMSKEFERLFHASSTE